MPNRFYLKGTRAEYIVRDALREAGWLVMRSYASKGAFDLLAVRPGRRNALLAVKGWGGRMSPAERSALRSMAVHYDCDAVAVHYAAGHLTYAHLDGEDWRP